MHILKSALYGTSVVVAAGARDSNVYVWRKKVPSGRSTREFTMATLAGHSGWVWSLASERDHRPHLLCSGSWDRSIKIWDISVGQCAVTIEYVLIRNQRGSMFPPLDNHPYYNRVALDTVQEYV